MAFRWRIARRAHGPLPPGGRLHCPGGHRRPCRSSLSVPGRTPPRHDKARRSRQAPWARAQKKIKAQVNQDSYHSQILLLGAVVRHPLSLTVHGGECYRSNGTIFPECLWPQDSSFSSCLPTRLIALCLWGIGGSNCGPSEPKSLVRRRTPIHSQKR